ncbi:hypothetical protein [Gordonia iterans]
MTSARDLLADRLRVLLAPERQLSEGRGWIEVSADVIDDEDALAAWLALALDYNRDVTDST